MFELFRYRNYTLLWCGQFISNIGDWAIWFALAYYTYQITGSNLATGTIFLTSVIPNIVFGPFAGVLVDRWDRRFTMITVDLLRAGLLLPMLLFRSANLAWLIYLLNFLLSTCSLLFNPAKGALGPLLVPREKLLTSNALSTIGSNVPRLAGPLQGGILLSLPGALNTVVLGDSATFLCSALLVTLIKMPATNIQTTKDTTLQKRTTLKEIALHLWQEWLDGLQVVKKQRLLLITFLMFGIASLAECPLLVLLAAFTINLLHSNATDMSWLIAVRGMGGLLGGLLIGGILTKVKIAPLLIVGFLTVSVGILLMASFIGLSMALVCFLGIGIGEILWSTGTNTLVVQATENVYLGRVIASYAMLAETFQLVGLAVVSASGDVLGILPWFYTTGILYFVATVIATLSRKLIYAVQ